MTTTMDGKTAARGYAPVNGLEMYYEVEGRGDPLVYIPNAFGFAGLVPFPSLIESHAVITMDLQGHGRTRDVPDRPLSIEHYADDVVELLRYLGVAKADFFGFSFGGNAATMIALRHPEIVRRVATWGATFGPGSVAHNPAMLRFDHPPTPDDDAFAFKREAYGRVAPDPDQWPTLWEKVATLQWEGFSNQELASINVPLLIALGDRDFVRLEHAVDVANRIPTAELSVVPDAGHFALMSEPERVLPIIKHFLEKPANRSPVATAGMGYQPGRTR